MQVVDRAETEQFSYFKKAFKRITKRFKTVKKIVVVNFDCATQYLHLM